MGGASKQDILTVKRTITAHFTPLSQLKMELMLFTTWFLVKGFVM